MNRLTAAFNMHEWDSRLISISVLIAALLVGVAIHGAPSFILSRLSRHIGTQWSTRLRGPVRILIPLLSLMLVVPTLELFTRTYEVIQHLSSICFIAVITWLGCQGTLAGRDIILGRFGAGLEPALQGARETA